MLQTLHRFLDLLLHLPNPEAPAGGELCLPSLHGHLKLQKLKTSVRPVDPINTSQSAKRWRNARFASL